ncbi:MAG TPA: FtsH protease activity modulator HflK [Planctomycetota bacterium]|nr:FtsH protease activity modulator HflK [Planctomycetota bacterium]
MSAPRGPRSLEDQLASQLANLDLKGLGPIAPLAVLALLLIAGLWSSIYTVQPEGEAVVKRFGRVVAIREPGLHFKLPFGIDRAIFVPTARVLKEEFGFRTVDAGQRSSYQKSRAHQDESLMLTGDLKVIDVEWVVQYRIADPDRFLHQVRNPSATIRDISEAVMRRIVGNSLGSDVLTEKRVQVATQARVELQEVLDSFGIGVAIGTIELQDVTPPELVKPAFNEVNQAEQERERLINEAEKRRNQVMPRAEGQAKQIIAEAEGYAAERVNRARGEAERFGAILAEYRNAPAVTRQRLFLETIDRVFPRLGRVLVVEEGVAAPIPLLHMDDRRSLSPPAKAADGAPADGAAAQGGGR